MSCTLLRLFMVAMLFQHMAFFLCMVSSWNIFVSDCFYRRHPNEPYRNKNHCKALWAYGTHCREDQIHQQVFTRHRQSTNPEQQKEDIATANLSKRTMPMSNSWHPSLHLSTQAYHWLFFFFEYIWHGRTSPPLKGGILLFALYLIKQSSPMIMVSSGRISVTWGIPNIGQTCGV